MTEQIRGSVQIQDFSISSDKYDPAGTPEFAKLGIGVNPATQDGLVHIFSGSGGAVSAHTNADELVIEHSTHAGISLLTPDASNSNIYFGTPSDSTGSYITWAHSSLLMYLGTHIVSGEVTIRSGNDVESIRIDSSQNILLGTGITPDVRLHVYLGNAGAVTASVDGIAIEDNNPVALNILTPDTNHSYVIFGSPSDNTGAVISWNYTDGEMHLNSATSGSQVVFGSDTGTEAMRIDASQDISMQGSLNVTGFIQPASSETSFLSSEVDPSFYRAGIGGGSYPFNAGSVGNLIIQAGTSTQRDILFATYNGTSVDYRMVIKENGNVVIGTLETPDGKLHIHSATAGTVTANTNANDLVIENSGDTGISILGPTTQLQHIYFGTPTDEVSAYIRWNHGASLAYFGTSISGGEVSLRAGDNAEAVRIDSSGNIGIGISTPDGTLHVFTSSAGTVTANTNADDLVVEAGGNGGLSILTPDASLGSIYFGTPSDDSGAYVRWDFTNDLMTVGTLNAGASLRLMSANNNERARIDSNGNVLLGTTTSPSANGGKVLVFGDNTNDPTMGTNTAGIYGKDVSGTVEMFAIDEGSAAQQLTPHDPKTGKWIAKVRNRDGVWMQVEMEEMMRALNEMLGGGFIKEWID